MNIDWPGCSKAAEFVIYGAPLGRTTTVEVLR